MAMVRNSANVGQTSQSHRGLAAEKKELEVGLITFDELWHDMT